MNGSEIKSVSAANVDMANGDTLEDTIATVNENIDNLNTPTFDDSTGTYITLNDANTAAETASNAIKSKGSIFTTLSNMKKSFSAIIQGLKILGTNVGMITGITSDLNSESDTIAASSKAIATLNSNLEAAALSITNLTGVTGELNLYKKCGVVTAGISLFLGVELPQYGLKIIGRVPDANFYPKTNIIGAAVWTDKYLQPFHVGYINIDNNGNIIIRTSDKTPAEYRLNASVSWICNS